MSTPSMFGPLLSLSRKLQTVRESSEEALSQCQRLNATKHEDLIRALADLKNDLLNLENQVTYMRKTEKDFRQK